MKKIEIVVKDPIEELKLLRLVMHGRVEEGVLKRFDELIIALDNSDRVRDGPDKLLMLLGFFIQQLPSIVSAIDALMNRNR